MADNLLNYQSSLLDFQRARRRANLEQIMARMTGKSADLLSYDDVREKLRARGGASRGLHDIPLDAIVGSVGRYNDFSRSFLPRQTVDAKRWAGVGLAMTGNMGLPPIEVYKIGDVYFVLDGNHRVSIARDMGATHIEAYVTEVYTKVPLRAGDSPDDLILKFRYAEFLERTKLDELRPGADLSTTAPGQYRVLDEHIHVHQYYMGIDWGRDISYTEAVTHWYDEVYLPVIDSIRQQDILREFPDRTETDLYIWIMEHREALAEELGWRVDTEDAVADLVAREGTSPARVLSRIRKRFLQAVALDSGSALSEKRTRRRGEWEICAQKCFAKDILVPVSGRDDGWAVVDMAIHLAHLEGGSLHGLHVVATEAELTESAALNVKHEFERRCADGGIPSSLKLVVGGIHQRIAEHARWVDLVTIQLFHPPGATPVARLGSGLRSLFLRCPVPILTIPAACASVNHILLAFDGSPKAWEALYIAAYMASHWQINLSVISVKERSGSADGALLDAECYLDEHEVAATLHSAEHEYAGVAIHEMAQRIDANLVVMGGYGHGGFVQVVLGSAVDFVLRQFKTPVLICR